MPHPRGGPCDQLWGGYCGSRELQFLCRILAAVPATTRPNLCFECGAMKFLCRILAAVPATLLKKMTQSEHKCFVSMPHPRGGPCDMKDYRWGC